MMSYWPKMEEIKELVQLDHGELQQRAGASPQTALSTMEVPTYFGDFKVCASAFGASALFFPYSEDFDVFDRFDYYGLAAASWGRKMAFEAGLELMGYTVGEVREFETPVDLSYLSPFQQDILLAVRKVPFGRTTTTPQLAETAGHPGKGGAASRVLRHNPLPVLVPCHRVLSAEGRIGAYCGSLEMKQFLLAHEGVDIELLSA
jgi:methylated-DNA-[protein]-cysteine S-methyltransferase